MDRSRPPPRPRPEAPARATAGFGSGGAWLPAEVLEPLLSSLLLESPLLLESSELLVESDVEEPSEDELVVHVERRGLALPRRLAFEPLAPLSARRRFAEVVPMLPPSAALQLHAVSCNVRSKSTSAATPCASRFAVSLSPT